MYRSPPVFKPSPSLEALLQADQRWLYQSQDYQMMSLALEIPAVDPLGVLGELVKPEQLSFYWECPRQGVAIAAWDVVAMLQTEGPQRFSQVETFIAAQKQQILVLGDRHLPWAGPHFFCSFTFFEAPTVSQSAFPATRAFLPRWQVACCQNRGILVANFRCLGKEDKHDIQEIVGPLLAQLDRVRANSLATTPQNGHVFQRHPVVEPRKLAKKMATAMEALTNQQLQKIVLAQALDVTSSQPLRVVQSLHNLRQTYPNCRVFAVGNGQGVSFIGASPERLLSLQGDRMLTDALAGSAPRGTTLKADGMLARDLLGSKKERYEQRVVVRFIGDRLRNLGLTPHIPSQVRLLQLSNIQHLWTPITADVPNTISPLTILADLHPTPAVAGLPRDITLDQIHRDETFDRALYAGPIGWIDPQDNCEFVVGIRSGLIDQGWARLYAGVGLVVGSQIHRELAEIQLKLQAILRTLV